MYGFYRRCGVVTEHTGTVERQLETLRRDFGNVFLVALADPETVEILLNPDGQRVVAILERYGVIPDLPPTRRSYGADAFPVK
jgi:hypothetical protein